MESLMLSLRQRKLLHYLKSRKLYTTGEELANHLHVSSRTIRNDITEINDALRSYGIRVISKRSIGYLLEADDPDTLKRLSQASSSFLSRDERVRHIAFQLSLYDEPLDLYDLEDEMFVSRTTLEHDLGALRKQYILPEPHIRFFRSRNAIYFEKNERKRRAILNRLFSENWNYNARGNTYYHYQYLDEDVVNLIMREINLHLTRYAIQIEDVNMVNLDMAVVIMYHRLSKGYPLTEPLTRTYKDPDAVLAADALLDSLEQKLSISFPPIEREDIYLHVSCSKRLDAGLLNMRTVSRYFSEDIIRLADTYIAEIAATYHIDFSGNEDFYIILLQYLRYLDLPVHYFNDIPTHNDVTRSQFLIEFEIASSIQPLALDYYGSYLDHTELLYLSFCISGALAYLNRTAPKLRTVIMSQLNLPSSWDLKQRLLSKYKSYIDLTALLPVYMKDNFDFSETDLVITTADKEITSRHGCETLLVSPFLTRADYENLDAHILKTQLNRLYHSSLPSLGELFEEAFWHERIDTEDYFEVIEMLAMDFIKSGYVSPEYLTAVLRRESLLTFAFQPSIVLMYSLTPSARTCLSVATLEHRIKRNSYKIRTVIMAALRPEDATLVFRLINELYYPGFNPNDTKFLKTRDELTAFFRTDPR
ncbi:MAG: HTH domain-containing protein [Dorea sp.]|jgi:lichenan operon transcriptional antiterminator|nr:HTH domain-containing protein [Dorea sp.]